MASIKVSLNISDKFNVNGNPGSKCIFRYEYKSDIIPRIGETVEVRNRDFKSLHDTVFSKDTPDFFVFNKIIGEDGWGCNEYVVKNITHKKYLVDLDVEATDKLLEKWDMRNKPTETLLECENKYSEHLREKTIRMKNEEDRKRNKFSLNPFKKRKK